MRVVAPGVFVARVVRGNPFHPHGCCDVVAVTNINGDFATACNVYINNYAIIYSITFCNSIRAIRGFGMGG
jgi:hypothetical protein